MYAQLAGAEKKRWNDRSESDHRGARRYPDQRCQPQAAYRADETAEVRNTSGKLARGIEIELVGIGETDAFLAYYRTRHGAPHVVRTRDSVCVRFESLWRSAGHLLSVANVAPRSMSTQHSLPFVWELSLFGAGACERFYIETSTGNIAAKCRWLVATDQCGNEFAAEPKAVSLFGC